MCDRFPRKFDVQTSYKPSNVIFVVNIKSPRATYHTIAPSTEELYRFKSDKHPISPYNTTVWSSIQVMRIKGLITNIRCLDVCANSLKLKFEIEKPETTLASHCHYSISKSSSPKTAKAPSSFTKKKTAKKPLFVHHQSAIPKKSKINFIRNERKRIEDRCSTQTTSIKHQNMFDDSLRINGYPEDSIDQTKHPQSHQRISPPPNVDWSYLKIPYMSERHNHKITNIFRKEGIPVRVAYRSYTLKRLSRATALRGSVYAPGTTAPPPKPIMPFKERRVPNHL